MNQRATDGAAPVRRATLVAVNRGAVAPFALPQRAARSAIDKRPVTGPVRVDTLGLEGDEQYEKRFHGGPRKAVLVYASEDLAWWAARLGLELPPGFIGENLTTAGLDVGGLRPGDALGIGEVILRVTEPRDPCTKLAARVGRRDFVKAFGRAGRTGAYCAVERAGTLAAGDAIVVVRGGGGATIREIVGETFGRDDDAAVAPRVTR